MIQLSLDEIYQDLVQLEELQAAARAALLAGGIEDSPSLTIRIAGEEEIQHLNSSYRDQDRITDVLAFPADFIDPDLETRYLGDVVICYPRAADGAERRGHSPGEELQLLVVHGVLHLLGCDHTEPAEKAEMWALQQASLRELGLDIEVDES